MPLKLLDFLKSEFHDFKILRFSGVLDPEDKFLNILRVDLIVR